MTNIDAKTGLWSDALNTRQVIVLHSTESNGAKGSLNWMQGQKDGSYQDLVDLNGDVYLMVPEDKQAWAARSTGNRIGLHVCATGWASWSEAKWLSYPAMIDAIARIVADWSAKYGIPLVRITPDQVRAGQRGVCTHDDISKAFGETDHTDPGAGFPLSVILAKARALLEQKGGASLSTDEEVKDIRAQLTGSANVGEFPGWHQLGARTLVDAVGAIGANLGIEGFYDTLGVVKGKG